MTKYLTATQAASRLGKSEKTVRRWITEGRLTAHHPQGRRNMLAISEDDIEQLATELAKYEKPEQELSPGPATDIAKRLDYVQGWLGDLQRWQTELEQRIQKLEDVLLSLAGPETPAAASRPARKRATASVGTLETPVDIPQGSLLHTEFAEHHGVHTRTFRDHIDKGKVPAIKRPKSNRPNEVERWLTPEDQQRAIDYWQEIGTAFSTRPDLYPNLNYGILSELEQGPEDQETFAED